MCLAAPLKIITRTGDMAKVGHNGVTLTVSVALTPEVEEGDWVLVHAGFAIHKLEAKDAAETLRLLEEFYEVNTL